MFGLFHFMANEILSLSQPFLNGETNRECKKIEISIWIINFHFLKVALPFIWGVKGIFYILAKQNLRLAPIDCCLNFVHETAAIHPFSYRRHHCVINSLASTATFLEKKTPPTTLKSQNCSDISENPANHLPIQIYELWRIASHWIVEHIFFIFPSETLFDIQFL